MPDLSALYAAVVAAPEDDAPRAAYAAAVAMTDHERAELISLQLRIHASRRDHGDPDERGKAAMRASALLDARGAEWAASVAPLVTDYGFVRGFVEYVTLDAAAFLARGEELYAAAPILHLELTNLLPVALAVFTSPLLHRLRSLDLHDNALGDLELAVLASQPLPSLRWLELRGNRIGRPGLDALAATKSLPRLAYVGLAGNAIPDPMPGIVDEYSTASPLARELQAANGKLAWLDLERDTPWPPARDALP